MTLSLFASPLSPELLTTDQMASCDRYAIDHGTPGVVLMEAAGRAVVDAVSDHAGQADLAVILCGPGNNGGDGFVAARLLVERGYRVRLGLLGDKAKLSGDAAIMADKWHGEIEPVSPGLLEGAGVIVDAIFGAGLVRDVTGTAAETISEINRCGAPVVCVDVPSGIDGNSGAIRGIAVHGDVTVTFFRAKPGHFLLPGREHCGELVVSNIGIPNAALDSVGWNTSLNGPAIWLHRFPALNAAEHKYQRGSVIVQSGDAEMTGAARLAARAALRSGAGLVTLVGTKAATAINAAHETAVMVRSYSGVNGLERILADDRINTVVIGPGAGAIKATRERVLCALESDAACVLDADALTAFEQHQKALFRAISERTAPVVLTPHDGEFVRLFGSVSADLSKPDQAREAALQSGATVILKGADSVVASPGAHATINANAPPWLATAGSGDVLAGFCAGLLAQGMPAPDAASAAVWLHGACAQQFGPGLIAEDLSETLPTVLRDLYSRLGL